MDKKVLIYGAAGYTAELIVEECIQQRLNPILAGRKSNNSYKIEALAKKYDLEYRIFNAKDAEQHINDIYLLLNCAGPFSETIKPILNACLNKKVHYLDITGEIEVFKYCYKNNELAKKQGIIVLPGVGFDIVPSDCFIQFLKEQLPDATRIDIGFKMGGGASIGTTKTLIEGLGKGGFVRENHKLKPVSNAYKYKLLSFPSGNKWAMSIPWGDVFTGGISTNVPNGLVYLVMPKQIIYLLKTLSPFDFILRSNFVKSYLKELVNKKFKIAGPQKARREKTNSEFWGEAENQKGDKINYTLTTQNSYTLTAEAAVKLTKYCLNAENKSGYFTPSMLAGSSFINELSETVIKKI